MQDDYVYLHPITVYHLEWNLQPHTKKPSNLDVVAKFSAQEISTLAKKTDWQSAIINCKLSIMSKNHSLFSLKMDASAVFECNLSKTEKYAGSDFEEVIKSEGSEQFMQQLRTTIASLTKILCYDELII